MGSLAFALSERVPLVVASRAFLNRSRLSSFIPNLTRRLLAFPPESLIDVDPYALQSLRMDLTEISSLRVRDVINALNNNDNLRWDHESDTATGIVGVARALRNLEIGGPVLRAPPPDVSLPPATSGAAVPAPPSSTTHPSPAPSGIPPSGDEPLVDGHFGGDIELLVGGDIEPPVPPSAVGSDIPLSEGPQRYTDIKLFDQADRELTPSDALLNKRTYALEIAVRVIREGLGRGRDDQPTVHVAGQTAPETVWVVLTNQSEDPDDPSQGAFHFNHRFEKLILPVSGDSEGSARFELKPILAGMRSGSGERREIGIRLYHKLNLIDQVNVGFWISASADAPIVQPAIELTFKHPEETGVETLRQTSSVRRLTISVDQLSLGQFRFALLSGDAETGKPALFGTRVLSETVLNGFVSEFREILLDAVFGPAIETGKMSSMEKDEIIKRLSLLGTRMINTLFDTQTGTGDIVALGDMLRSGLPDASLVQVSLLEDAKDFVFPWQILTIKDDVEPDDPSDIENLWGWRYILEVKRCGDGVDQRSTQATMPVRIGYGRWNFINEPDHFAHLQGLVDTAKIPIELTTPVIDDGAAFVAALRGGMDLLYVYAHGHAAVPPTPRGTPSGIAHERRSRP